MSGRQGQGNRLAGRSEAQRANARRYTEQHPGSLPADAGLPDSSWWAEPLTWEAFAAAVAHEQLRMADSKFGGYRGNGMREQD